MSEQGPTRELPHDFYGRQVKLEVQTSPQKSSGVGFFLVALGVVGILFGAAADDGRAIIVALCGALLIPVGFFMIYGGIQLAKMPTKHIRLGLKTLKFPRGKLLWSAPEEEVSLREITRVSLMTQNNVLSVRFDLTDGTNHHISQAWLPPEWSAIDFFVLLQLRTNGLHQQRTRAQQVGAEAQVLAAGPDALGVVVDTRKKIPRAYAVVHDLEDYAELMSTKGFPVSDHILTVPADRVQETRDVLKNAIVEAVDAERPPLPGAV